MQEDNKIKERANIFFKKRVLITGFNGFLGSWLTKALIKQGAIVYGIDIVTKRKITILSDNDLKNVRITKGSVETYQLLLNILKKNGIEVIYHLAAKSTVGESYSEPLDAFSTNIRGTWNVLEASRQCRCVRAVIIASSDKAYGIKNKLPYEETASLAGCHPYDVSKSCADLLAKTYFYTYGVPVGVTRCGNIFGPGDFHFFRIVPDTIRCGLAGKALMLRSNGMFTRDYIYVEDVVEGYLLVARALLMNKFMGEAFNFSNEDPIKVLQLVRTIFKLMGKKAKYRILNEARYEIEHQYLSSKKALKLLGWKPHYSLEQGLMLTIRWYKEKLASDDI